jgi:hypothetical protein
MKTSMLLISLALSGCVTCSEHPVVCGVAGAIVVGSIAASVSHHGNATALPLHRVNSQPVNCIGGMCE